MNHVSSCSRRVHEYGLEWLRRHGEEEITQDSTLPTICGLQRKLTSSDQAGAGPVARTVGAEDMKMCVQHSLGC